METLISMKGKDVILFKTSDHKKYCNKLKNFLLFLEFYQVKKPIKFSHVSLSGGLIPNMTLMENILLDSIPNSLLSSKEKQLLNYLQKSGNIHLTRLLNKMEGLDKKASEVDVQNRKLASLIKALLKPSDFLFFENPGEHLSTENLEIFKLALKYHINNTNVITFIATDFENRWYKECNKIAHRNKEDQFKLSYVFRNESDRQQETEKYRPTPDTGHLKIYHPPGYGPKKDAA